IPDTESVFVIEVLRRVVDEPRSIDLSVLIRHCPMHAAEDDNLPPIQLSQARNISKKFPVKMVLVLERYVLIGQKLVKVQVAEGILNGKESLVTGNNVHQPKRNRSESLSGFDNNIGASQRTDDNRLFIVKLDFLIVEITVEQLLHARCIVEENRRVRIVHIISFDTKTDGT